MILLKLGFPKVQIDKMSEDDVDAYMAIHEAIREIEIEQING